MKKTMHIILAAALFALAGTGCRSVNPRSALDSPTRQIQSFDDRGRITETVIDNSGRAAAADGQVVSTTSPAIEKLAEKINGNEWSYTELTYSMVDEANTALLNQKKAEHKDALAAMDQAMQTGDMNKYKIAAEAVSALAGDIKNLLAKSNTQKPGGDRLSLAGKTLSVGEGHGDVITAQSKEFGLSVRSRHEHPGSNVQTNITESTDISTPAEVSAALDAKVKIGNQIIALKKIEADLAKATAANKVNPVNPVTPSVDPDNPDEPDTPDTDGMTPAQRLEAWYPSALKTDDAGFKPDESGLWKPGVGDKENMRTSNGKLAIHTPHSKLGRVIKIIVDDEASGVGQTGNGGRPLFRFSKSGGSYSGNVSLITDQGTYTAKASNPAARCSLDFKLATPASDLEPEAEPVTPDPAIGNTVPVPEI